jgi:hypothetical protein
MSEDLNRLEESPSVSYLDISPSELREKRRVLSSLDEVGGGFRC